MILWPFQPLGVFDLIQQTGRYVCDESIPYKTMYAGWLFKAK